MSSASGTDALGGACSKTAELATKLRKKTPIGKHINPVSAYFNIV